MAVHTLCEHELFLYNTLPIHTHCKYPKYHKETIAYTFYSNEQIVTISYYKNDERKVFHPFFVAFVIADS